MLLSASASASVTFKHSCSKYTFRDNALKFKYVVKQKNSIFFFRFYELWSTFDEIIDVLIFGKFFLNACDQARAKTI